MHRGIVIFSSNALLTMKDQILETTANTWEKDDTVLPGTYTMSSLKHKSLNATEESEEELVPVLRVIFPPFC